MVRLVNNKSIEERENKYTWFTDAFPTPPGRPPQEYNPGELLNAAESTHESVCTPALSVKTLKRYLTTHPGEND
jgi:hypothetical protein